MADPNHNLKDRLLNDLGSSFGSPADRVGNPPVPTLPTIPDHALLRCIGTGSYGEVWLARNALGTFRGVKIVRRRAFDSDRPYEREFAGIRRFEPVSRSHPSQLNVLHVGRDDAAGLFYYVMELADDAGTAPKVATPAAGAALPTLDPEIYVPRTIRSEIQKRGGLPCAECVDIGTALATALDHLHRHGLVHRDIKPSNIIFVNGIPKLADIGLVTHVEATLSFVGTEGYVPPEGPGTPQADIYSFGKVLYEMSTGRDRQDYPELPTNLIAVPVVERAALAELNEVVVKACHPDSKQRYQTAAELHADLALLQSGKSVTRMRTVERRLQCVARAGALVTAVALLAGGAWFWQQRQTRDARELARQNRQLAEERTTLATEKTKLADNLAKLDAENRDRIVRLDIANGVRLLDDGDPAGALLWFADALPMLTNNPAQESIHRIRIQQTLDQVPRLLQVFPHESSVQSAVFSPDGRFVATGTRDGQIRVWNAAEGSLVWGPKAMGAELVFLRFSRGGRRLFVSSSNEEWAFNGGIGSRNFYAVLEADSGGEIFSSRQADPAAWTNLTCSHFSPDDHWLASAQKDNCIRVFDLADGRLVQELRGHNDEVRFLSFSQDGSLLASASLDRTVRLWRLPSGEPVGPPLEHRFPVVRALLSGDGQHLITGSFENPGCLGNAGSEAGKGEIQAWDTATGQKLGDPIQRRDWLLVYLNPADPRRFYGPDSAYQIGSSVEPLFKIQAGAVQSWAFTKDNRWLAVGEAEKAARVMDATIGELVAGPFPHGGEVSAIQISPDEKLLLTACGDGNARIWDLRVAPSESIRRVLPAPMEQTDPVAMELEIGKTPAGTPIPMKNEQGLWLFNDKLEAVRQLESSQLKFDVIQSAWHSDFWVTWQFDDDSKRLILYGSQGTAAQRTLLKHPSQVLAVVFTGDDRFLVTLCGDHTVRFWRTVDGTLDRTIALPKVLVYALSPDGRTLVCVRDNQDGHPVFEFLDLESGEITGKPNIIVGAIFRADFSPGGQRVAFLDRNGPVTVLEARTGRVLSSTIAHPANLKAVEWDHAQHRLLTVGHDDQVLVWDVENGEQVLGPLRTPGANIRTAKWSLDDRFIITSSDNKTARVWDATTGEAITPSLKHDGEVAFAFLTGSQRLITGSYPDLLRAWDLRETTLAPDVLADYVKLLSSRRLGIGGALLTLKTEERAELNRSLRTRAPGLFQ
jgi:WD40 repeat protein/serine/threonine protein kinase